ncbi:MAG: hypothetical protein V3T72_22185 [Thermoanaerobaculia bacterium]
MFEYARLESTGRVVNLLILVTAWATAVAAQEPPPLGPQFQVNVLTMSQQILPVVAVDPDGGFVVAWESYNSGGSSDIGIQVRRLDNLGLPTGSELLVNGSAFGIQRKPDVAFLANDGFLVVWESFTNVDDPDDGLQGRLFNRDATPIGGDFPLNSLITLRQIQPALAARPSGGFVVSWASDVSESTDEDGLSIQARLFDAGGVPFGPEFQVNTSTTSLQHKPAVAALADDELVVVWESLFSASGPGTTVLGQLFDSAGMTIGGEIEVSSNTSGIDQEPAVAADPAGGFVVVWQRFGAGIPDAGLGIAGRRFDALGDPLGPEFQINSNTSGQQKVPQVTVADDGSLLVIWEHEQQTQQEIRGRQFDGDGDPLAPDFRIDTADGYANAAARVSRRHDSSFVVVWQSYGSPADDQSAHSIQARSFPAIGVFTDGFESGDTSAWSSATAR